MLLLSYKINKAVDILPRQATATNQKRKVSRLYHNRRDGTRL
nr:MAG TPA: hypothetical protein [Caudoviricetes sp.]